MSTLGQNHPQRNRSEMEDEEEAGEEATSTQFLPGTSTELLPGISNSITLHEICKRLHWKSLITLTAVSRSWEETVQRGATYDERVDSHSTDELAVVKYSKLPGKSFYNRIDGLALYSAKDKACYELPPFAAGGREIRQAYRCVTLNGKIYILGGLSANSASSSEVCVLDLARQRPWKRCANMLLSRSHFGCGVITAKIYVFGGISLGKPVDTAEVYDPEVDAWTAIKPLTLARYDHQVGIVGDELVVYGGKSCQPLLRNMAEVPAGDMWIDDGPADYLEVYNPVQDTWRIWSNGPWRETSRETFFMFESKLHSMTASKIFVFDIENKSKTPLQSCSYAIQGLRSMPEHGPVAIVPIDGELLAIVDCRVRGELIIRRSIGPNQPRLHFRENECLLQSEGFGDEDNEIVWEKAEWSHSFRRLVSPFIVSLRL